MMNITLKQLRYFQALARLGHFGHAAAACSISQPALSLQIKELEERAGAVLIERMSTGVKLTPLGHAFLERTQEILSAVNDLGDLTRKQQSDPGGPMYLGIIPTIAPYFLTQIIGPIAERFPELQLHLREAMTHKLMEELQNCQLDAAIVALPLSEPNLEEMPLFDERFVLVRHRTEQHLPVPTPDMLQEMQLMLLEEGHCFRDQALSLCNIKTPRHRGSLEASSLATLVQMVAEGLGVTLIPEMAIKVETRGVDVSIVHFEADEPKRQVGLVWRKTSPLSAQYKKIANLLAELGRTSQN